jgi:hypothetical protein
MLVPPRAQGSQLFCEFLRAAFVMAICTWHTEFSMDRRRCDESHGLLQDHCVICRTWIGKEGSLGQDYLATTLCHNATVPPIDRIVVRRYEQDFKEYWCHDESKLSYGIWNCALITM